VVAHRNTDPARYTPETAGHMGFGDRSGAKQGTVQTYLADAADGGARILVRTHADHVMVEAGRAAGVIATQRHRDGSESEVTVRAPTVVVAGGALETPALLQRSGIGGPAAGRYLRLHPVCALVGFYPDDQDAWWGPPQSIVVDEFSDLRDGYGFLVETPHFGTGLTAASVPWRSGRDHKLMMGRGAKAASLIGLVRDHGSGTVAIDEHGKAVVHYPLDDQIDLRHLRVALGALARLHAAAGATALVDLEPERSVWKRGDDLEAYIRRIEQLDFGNGGRLVFSAHQMGSARMGRDSTSHVADPEGQLHDTPGVWIGDTSAFPTPPGSNPMLTCMALAHRTAHAILAATPAA
jgi:choline dehydrogenase-like flavoprotein